MAIEMIQTVNAPKAVGPYSQASKMAAAAPLIFVSGQLPIDLESGKLITGAPFALTHKVIDHLEAILTASGSSLSQVVRCEVFLTDLGHFGEVNRAYGQRFIGILPARQTIQVAALPMGSTIEISCIATFG